MKIKNFQRLNIFLILFSFILIAIKWGDLPNRVPIFYSRPWGEDQLAKKGYLLILPFLSSTFLVLNLFLSNFFAKRKLEFFTQTAAIVSVAVAFFALISLWKIIFLIT